VSHSSVLASVRPSAESKPDCPDRRPRPSSGSWRSAPGSSCPGLRRLLRAAAIARRSPRAQRGQPSLARLPAPTRPVPPHRWLPPCL